MQGGFIAKSDFFGSDQGSEVRLTLGFTGFGAQKIFLKILENPSKWLDFGQLVGVFGPFVNVDFGGAAGHVA